MCARSRRCVISFRSRKESLAACGLGEQRFGSARRRRRRRLDGGHMKVDEINTQRFAVALQPLKEGSTLTFDAVNFWFSGDCLNVDVESSWWIGILMKRERQRIWKGQGCFRLSRSRKP